MHLEFRQAASRYSRDRSILEWNGNATCGACSIQMRVESSIRLLDTWIADTSASASLDIGISASGPTWTRKQESLGEEEVSFKRLSLVSINGYDHHALECWKQLSGNR